MNSEEPIPCEALMRERVRRIFAFLDGVVAELSVPPNYRELLKVHLEIGRERATAWPEMPSIQLPLLVYAAVTGDEQPALPVAAACTLLNLGADLFDSILDDELQSSWRVRNPAEASLAATTLVGALPQISLARLQGQGMPPAQLWQLAHQFAITGLEMGAGQHEDLLFSNLENVSLEDSRTMSERKSGSEYALFARAGAMLATEDPSKIKEYTAFGLCLGTARQLLNDVCDIWGDGLSKDLSNGKRTFPIVYALNTLRGEQGERLRNLLSASRESQEHRDEVRAMLEAAGSVRHTALVVWLYQQRARSHLASACPLERAAQHLRLLTNRTSLFPGSRRQLLPTSVPESR